MQVISIILGKTNCCYLFLISQFITVILFEDGLLLSYTVNLQCAVSFAFLKWFTNEYNYINNSYNIIVDDGLQTDVDLFFALKVVLK